MNTNRLFTEEQDQEVARLYVEEELSSLKIAKIFNVDKSTVLESLKLQGIERRSLRAFDDDEEQEIISDYLDGMNMSEIARELDCSPNLIWSVIKRNGIESRGNHGILERDDQEIYDLYLSGKSKKEICEIFSCWRGSINTSLQRSGAEDAMQELINQREQEIVDLYNSGYSMSEVSEIVDYYKNSSTISKILKKHNVDTRTHLYGERKYSVNEHAFDEIDTEHKAYFFGLIYADGCTTIRNQVKFGLHARDVDILYKFAEFLESDYPVRLSNKRCEIAVTSKIMHDALTSKGIIPGRRHFYLAEPHIPLHLEHHFIRGLFDGDGCISTNHDHFVITNRRDCLEWVRKVICENTGANFNTIRKRHGTSEVSWGGINITTKIIRYIYQDATVWMDRKYYRAQKYF